MNEKISVIITTKNRLGYLKEALNSVINQTYKNKEIIVINDGSEDDTKKWLDSLENKNNFNIIHNKTSKGKFILFFYFLFIIGFSFVPLNISYFYVSIFLLYNIKIKKKEINK